MVAQKSGNMLSYKNLYQKIKLCPRNQYCWY